MHEERVFKKKKGRLQDIKLFHCHIITFFVCGRAWNIRLPTEFLPSRAANHFLSFVRRDERVHGGSAGSKGHQLKRRNSSVLDETTISSRQDHPPAP